MIAALYVQKDGCYWDLPGVDPWDEARDARLYDGPWPVVAHPPCERWGKFWAGSPIAISRGERKIKGDDGGCFAAALASVRRWGGVLEHPEGSHAWQAFGLCEPPASGAWVSTDFVGGWTCRVEQGHYGHRARKSTWLYASGVDLPSLIWGRAAGDFMRIGGFDLRPYAKRCGKVGFLSRRERKATPPIFRDLLISIAATARPQQVAA